MDTTFSQRRDAPYSFTCLMSTKLGFVYYAKVLDKKTTKLKAVKIEGEASMKLVERALEDKRTGLGPDWRVYVRTASWRMLRCSLSSLANT